MENHREDLWREGLWFVPAIGNRMTAERFQQYAIWIYHFSRPTIEEVITEDKFADIWAVFNGRVLWRVK